LILTEGLRRFAAIGGDAPPRSQSRAPFAIGKKADA
jgi:hypothetical protein